MNPKMTENTPVLRGIQAKYVRWERVKEYEKILSKFRADPCKMRTRIISTIFDNERIQN